MKCDEVNSPAFIDLTLHNAPYSPSLATSASVSSTSVWSDASSQNSDDTSISAPTSDSDSDSCDPYSHSRQNNPPQTSTLSVELTSTWAKPRLQPQVEVPPELRQNPRRTSTSRSGCPPSLVRQCDRKVNFVDNLVGKITTQIRSPSPRAQPSIQIRRLRS